MERTAIFLHRRKRNLPPFCRLPPDERREYAQKRALKPLLTPPLFCIARPQTPAFSPCRSQWRDADCRSRKDNEWRISVEKTVEPVIRGLSRGNAD